ncbi:hypothetical protein GGS23DRAFT_77760 [Durotheca rogersii]|uniref:uncharacterized protein n=1 Tax=Durotheca rogersii TaxID=419775 RepID=UPI00221F2B70|nr:uncharacterized protein GGS23DRAFT_77760 [Durotheca rogersii]KAI5862477.1 hypothetical protein GGS23DRAFT_77760 [Durotheca rogersii]
MPARLAEREVDGSILPKRTTPSGRISRREPSYVVRVVCFSCLKKQLAVSLDDDVLCPDRWGKFGAIGVLFHITLHEYGYTFVAKGVRSA